MVVARPHHPVEVHVERSMCQPMHCVHVVVLPSSASLAISASALASTQCDQQTYGLPLSEVDPLSVVSVMLGADLQIPEQWHWRPDYQDTPPQCLPLQDGQGAKGKSNIILVHCCFCQ